VPQARRTTVHNLGEGFYQIELRYGFFEQPDVPAALEAIVATDFGFDRTAATYVLGMETVIATDRPGMALWRDHVFAFLHRNSSSAVQYFRLPAPQVIEVGTQVEI